MFPWLFSPNKSQIVPTNVLTLTTFNNLSWLLLYATIYSTHYKYVYIHTYIHTYIHIYIYNYIHHQKEAKYIFITSYPSISQELGPSSNHKPPATPPASWTLRPSPGASGGESPRHGPAGRRRDRPGGMTYGEIFGDDVIEYVCI